MNCDNIKLVEFLNGDLAREEQETILSHLEECPRCDRAFRDMLKIKTLAPEITPGLSPEFYRFDREPVHFYRWKMVFGMAAGLLLCLLAGLFLMKGWLEKRTGESWVALLETEPFPFVSPVVRGEDDPAGVSREAVMGLYRESQFAAFLKSFERYRQQQKPDGRMFFYAGVAAYLCKEYKRAGELLREAEQIEGARPETLWYLGNAAARWGGREEARQALARLAATDHPFAPRAAVLLQSLEERK